MADTDRLNAIVADITDVIDEMIAGAALQTLSEAGHDKRIRHVESPCGQVFNAGRSAGWDSHATLVRERLAKLSEIGLTEDQFHNLPVPEWEPWH